MIGSSHKWVRRLTRRRLLAAASAFAGTATLGRVGFARQEVATPEEGTPEEGQEPTPTPTEPATPGETATPEGEVEQTPTATPDVPENPAGMLGQPLSHVGGRSPFFDPERTFAENPTDLASWSFTPLQDLYGTITPSDLFFERHHAGVPLIDPTEHTLLIHGLVDRPLEFTVEDIRRFPSMTRVMFLECSGNSLYLYGETDPDDTVQNLHGLTSNVEWVGVPVSTLLNEVGVQPEAQWALAEGRDGATMTRSIPVEKLMDDAFIAYGQNGEPLRPEQGYPMRLLLPGWEGNTNIKWLRRIELGDQPWMHREETSKYSDVLEDEGSIRQFTFPMVTKSVITWPSPGKVIPEPGAWEIRGIAWSALGRITRVEVSTDGGASWNDATLSGPVYPIAHTRFNYWWEWDGEETTIMSRAIDETGYVQPSREEVLELRGDDYVYHYNGIQTWIVRSDGSVQNGAA